VTSDGSEVLSTPARHSSHAPLRRLLRLVGWLLLGWLLVTFVVVLLLRWIDPPTSAFILRERIVAASSKPAYAVRHRWVDAAQISPYMKLAVIASEDQTFPAHYGFDFRSIDKALDERESGRRVRGASTISQQTAKNLFLWGGRSFVRKGLEAYFTVLLELTWPKRRILEVYLNTAEFGDGIYGAQAAALAFFHKDAAQLDAREAALLATVLPNPKKLHADRPSAYVARHAEWVERQVRQLGGPGYLAR
jgi:monofunctional biosynthetic peptidoglycan transglycosylase